VLDAERDAMRASGEAFAHELRAAGVPVEHHLVRGAAHAFLHRPRDRAFAPGIARIAGWVRSR
jgi:acetyl esterase